MEGRQQVLSGPQGLEKMWFRGPCWALLDLVLTAQSECRAENDKEEHVAVKIPTGLLPGQGKVRQGKVR